MGVFCILMYEIKFSPIRILYQLLDEVNIYYITVFSGHTIGEKGALYAAKIMAGTAYDLLINPEIVEKAKASFLKDKGDRVYVPAFKK